RYPRAADYQGEGAAPSPMPEVLKTVVRIGTTIGAGALIGPGVDIGPWAMVGMGAVVTRDVLPHALMVGAPARVAGWVCVCGTPLGGAASPVSSRTSRTAAALDDSPGSTCPLGMVHTRAPLSEWRRAARTTATSPRRRR